MELKHFNYFVFRTPYGFWNNKILSKDQIAVASFDLAELNDENVRIPLIKYLQRTNFRATPFGLFASVGVGKFGNSSKIILDTKSYRRETRFDYALLMQISKYMSELPFANKYIKYYANNTIYETTDSFRFINFKELTSKYDNITLKKDGIIEKILKECKKGLEKKSLIKLIDVSASLEEKDFYINELIESGVLISELTPVIVCEDVAENFINKLNSILKRSNNTDAKLIENEIKWVNEIKSYLNKIDKSGISDTNISLYKKIHEILDLKNISYKKNKVFHVDLYSKTIEAVLEESTIPKISKAIYALSRIGNMKSEDTIGLFKEKFLKKWDHEMVPLLFALDPETGIDYSTIKPENKKNNIDERFIFLSSKLFSASKAGSYEINITKEEIEPIQPTQYNLPASFLANCTLFKEANESKLYVDSIGGHTGVFMLGRFCGSSRIKDLVESICNKEQEIHEVSKLVEIAFLPTTGAGNVVQRPALRNLTLPIFVHSNDEDASLINLSDIMVFISNDKINLYDRKTKSIITPRLSNAHDFSASFSLYRFLCDLQGQGYTSSFRLDFDLFDKALQFIPRIVYDNSIILQRAKWILYKKNFLQSGEKWNNEKIIELLLQFKLLYSMPRFISIDGESQIVIDTEDTNSLLILSEELKRFNVIRVYETLFDERFNFVTDENSKIYAHEIIIPLYKTTHKELENKHIFAQSNHIKRKYFPGSEWMYFKIYIGSITSSEILFELSNECDSLKDSKIIQGYFFIRYSDPDFHIRFRVKINDINSYSLVAQIFHTIWEKYFENKSLNKIQIDTYDRELERYGFTDISYVEAIFIEDSRYILKILKEISLFENQDYYTLTIGVCIAHVYLEIAGLETHSRIKLLENSLSNKKFDKEFSKKIFRENYKEIENFIDSNFHEDLLKIFNDYKKTISKLEFPNFKNLVGDLIHMSLNRLFYTDTYEQEHIVYSILEKHYKRNNAINLYQTKNF